MNAIFSPQMAQSCEVSFDGTFAFQKVVNVLPNQMPIGRIFDFDFLSPKLNLNIVFVFICVSLNLPPLHSIGLENLLCLLNLQLISFLLFLSF